MGGSRYATDYTDSAEGIFHGVIVVFLGRTNTFFIVSSMCQENKILFCIMQD